MSVKLLTGKVAVPPKFSAFKKYVDSNKAPIVGAGIGAVAGGTTGYASTKDNKNRPLNTGLGALAGIPLGILGGKLYKRYNAGHIFNGDVKSVTPTIRTEPVKVHRFDRPEVSTSNKRIPRAEQPFIRPQQ